MVNPNQMSYFMRQLKTNEGQSQLQGELKIEANRFKNGWIKELNADQLFQNRTLFCSAGIATTQRTNRKLDEWKKKNWEPTGFGKKRNAPANAAMFSYFGLDPPKGNKLDMAALGKLLKASQTHGVNMDQELQDYLEEEARLKWEAHLKRIHQWPPKPVKEPTPPPTPPPKPLDLGFDSPLGQFHMMMKKR